MYNIYAKICSGKNNEKHFSWIKKVEKSSKLESRYMSYKIIKKYTTKNFLGCKPVYFLVIDFKHKWTSTDSGCVKYVTFFLEKHFISCALRTLNKDKFGTHSNHCLLYSKMYFKCRWYFSNKLKNTKAAIVLFNL